MYTLRPFSPVPLDLRIECLVLREGDFMRAEFNLSGDVEKIQIPKPGQAPARKDDLWKKTCFEIFVAPHGAENYREFNFSPSGDWNCYAFDRYREGMKAEQLVPTPQLETRIANGKYQLATKVDLSRIFLETVELEFSATAVIENQDGKISYWAVHHAGGQPDFHLRKSFSKPGIQK